MNLTFKVFYCRNKYSRQLVTEDSIVASWPEKIGLYDYHLFKVSSSSRLLKTEEVDGYGYCYPRGSKVF